MTLSDNHSRPSASVRLAISAASLNHPTNRPPLLIQIDAPFSSRLSRHTCPDDTLRRVDNAACFSFGGRRMKASKALIGKQVAIRPTENDGVFDLVFRHVTFKSIDFHKQR